MMVQKQVDKALEELFEAFKCYQEIGQGDKAKVLLKYTILGSIISGSEIDYATTAEAKVFKDDEEIQACVDIRNASDSNDVNMILQKLDLIEKDDFIHKILDDFLTIVRLNAIQIKIKPYLTVSLEHLAKELKISVQDVKMLLTELILENKIDGRIDQETGYYEKRATDREVEEENKHLALYKWAETLVSINNSLIQNF